MNPSFAPERRKEVLRLRHLGTNGHGAVVNNAFYIAQEANSAIDGERRLLVKLRMAKIAAMIILSGIPSHPLQQIRAGQMLKWSQSDFSQTAWGNLRPSFCLLPTGHEFERVSDEICSSLLLKSAREIVSRKHQRRLACKAFLQLHFAVGLPSRNQE